MWLGGASSTENLFRDHLLFHGVWPSYLSLSLCKKVEQCRDLFAENVDANNMHTIIGLTKVHLIGTEVVLIGMFSPGCLIMDSRAGASKSD